MDMPTPPRRPVRPENQYSRSGGGAPIWRDIVRQRALERRARLVGQWSARLDQAREILDARQRELERDLGGQIPRTAYETDGDFTAVPGRRQQRDVDGDTDAGGREPGPSPRRARPQRPRPNRSAGRP